MAAPFADVLATIRDVESQPDWIPEILEAELLEVYEDDDLPATARFKASATVGTDEYTLSYEHTDDGHELDDAGGPHADRPGGPLHAPGAGAGRDRR